MKVLCILWDLCGIYAFFKMFADSKGDVPTILGALIGIILICGLPTYFCFREKKD